VLSHTVSSLHRISFCAIWPTHNGLAFANVVNVCVFVSLQRQCRSNSEAQELNVQIILKLSACHQILPTWRLPP